VYDLEVSVFLIFSGMLWIQDKCSVHLRSLFFSLMKRTKNQGCGIVVKALFSNLIGDFLFDALYFDRF
jgi:hypothetical protein